MKIKKSTILKMCGGLMAITLSGYVPFCNYNITTTEKQPEEKLVSEPVEKKETEKETVEEKEEETVKEKEEEETVEVTNIPEEIVIEEPIYSYETYAQEYYSIPQEEVTYAPVYSDSYLTAAGGVNYNQNGYKETWYNLPMHGVISNAQNNGIYGDYWVRDDGAKMYGDYIIVAADQNLHPYGSVVDTSLGQGIVLDTGTFIYSNSQQFDIATAW